MQKTIDYWLEEAEEALKVADHLFEKRTFPIRYSLAIWLWKNLSKLFMFRKEMNMRSNSQSGKTR